MDEELKYKLGIHKNSPYIQNLLTDLAYGDCAHDFSDIQISTIMKKLENSKNVRDETVEIGKGLIDFLHNKTDTIVNGKA